MMRWLGFILAVLVSGSAVAAPSAVPARRPDRVITAVITRADHQRYRRVPFIVPRGTVRLMVAFDYDTREQKTVIDLAVEDQHGLRGSSGGNKANFTIGESDATPSYLSGRIAPGQWQLVLAVPNIRPGISARWTARLWFLRGAEAGTLASPVIDPGPGWYHGDLHLHTAHSDGVCTSQQGRSVPCPVFKTLEMAAARGLDFVAITDHNSSSAQAAMREAEPYFDRLLLIPGREITTFFGHFNIFGVSTAIDYRVTPGGPVTFNAIADRVHALGGLVSINHPALPSGEPCMGCGWAMPAADLRRVDAIEVVNGGAARLPGGVVGVLSGMQMWLNALSDGHPIAAIGGSDNHDGAQAADLAGTIGRPTTVVWADGLNQQAILAGIRAGRVFVDLAGTAGSMLDLAVTSDRSTATMGGQLNAKPGEALVVRVSVRAPTGCTLDILAGEDVIASRVLNDSGDYMVPINRPERPLVVHALVRSPEGKIRLLSNAVVVSLRNPD
ncbi:CehA/McbA family metallohydrolase [Sphingomonas sp. 28-63-12]|uniref:CehA/McbA family metallohydrolase n=1 Tax=Sphingomonas sp. 28-63-12 TaxID=1970434 RepID=UPI000BD1F46D|nr:MAG: hypothetical protein B7Y47_07875 [Sphingomonas sp. 28-63-12]